MRSQSSPRRPEQPATGYRAKYSTQPGQSSKKRLPAYGRQFIGRPFAWLRLGHKGMAQAAEEVQRGVRNVLALSPGVSPAEVDWSLLAGLDVLVIEHDDQGQEYRLCLMRSLALAGANVGFLIPASRLQEDFIMIGVRPLALAGKEAA